MSKRALNTDAPSSSAQDKPLHTDRDSRISKGNLCMVLALWMEQFPLRSDEEKEIHPFRKVGAVLVLPNDMLYAVDCSRDGVHGVARLLMKHYDVAKDCYMYVSRKPCSFCAKLLVQCKIKRVFYLPIEPEYKDLEAFKDETARVDNLFKTSALGQSVFVPVVENEVFEKAEKKKPTPLETREEITLEFLGSYWNEEWMENAKDDLPWPAFEDNMKSQVRKDFSGIMEWMARIVIGERKGYAFEAISRVGTIQFDPNKNHERKQASHLMTMAKFLAERSDDPKTGVGAVITNTALEIVALGWNGFPIKALYGEFARASHDDQVADKKYPYVIHAEQNALLMRNTKNLSDGILFVTQTPCDECCPLLAMEKIKTVVLGGQLEKKISPGNLNYSKFFEKVHKGTFTCFEMRSADELSGESPTKIQKIDFDEEDQEKLN